MHEDEPVDSRRQGKPCQVVMLLATLIAVIVLTVLEAPTIAFVTIGGLGCGLTSFGLKRP